MRRLWDFLTANKYKKARNKIIKSAIVVGKYAPVNAISAVNGIYRVTQIGNSVANAADSVARCAGVVRYFQIFSSLMAVGNLVVTYQGVRALQLITAHLKDINETLQAQTALMSMREFPRAVYDMVREATDNNPDTASCSHLFFVYHPDTDWTGGFHRLVMKKPLSPRFCMHTNQLDSAVLYMKAVRTYLNRLAEYDRKRGKPRPSVKLHLLIPAYRPLVMIDPVKFPNDLGDFEVHGKIHNSQPLVWIHVSEDQEHFLTDIGFWKPPKIGFLDWVAGLVGFSDAPINLAKLRVLGNARPEPDSDDETDSDYEDSVERDSSDDDSSNDDSSDDDSSDDDSSNDGGHGRRSRSRSRGYSKDTSHKPSRHSLNRPSSSRAKTRQRSEVRDKRAKASGGSRSRATRSKSRHTSTGCHRKSRSRAKD